MSDERRLPRCLQHNWQCRAVDVIAPLPKLRQERNLQMKDEMALRQAQWNSFFKKLVPGSNLLSRMVESSLGLDSGVLENSQPMPTELASRRVAQALHMRGRWKDLRSDGFFRPSSPAPIIGYEYQSTHNTGMLVRTAMYGEAFRETNPGLAEDRGLEFVVLYSGHDMPRSDARALHNKKVSRNVEYLFLDLSQIDANALEQDTLESVVLRLSRHDADNLDLFLRTARRIREEVCDATTRDTLLTALIVASTNKPELARVVHGRIELDENLKRGLDIFIASYGDTRIQEIEMQMMRTHMMDLVDIGDGPEAIKDRIESASLEELNDLKVHIKEAARTREWSNLTGDSPSP